MCPINELLFWNRLEMASYSGVCCKLATPMVAVVRFGQHRDARDRACAKFKPPRLILRHLKWLLAGIMALGVLIGAGSVYKDRCEALCPH